MFTSARLKLTAWYLLIIMLVSGIFSVVIFQGINQDYDRIERIQKLRQEAIRSNYENFFNLQFPGQGFQIVPAPPPELDTSAIDEARRRLIANLLLVNLGILFASGFAGYFLAGRTLKPIQEMVEEQNRFITDASHELRTPLTALKTSIEVGLRDLKITKQEAVGLLKSNLEEVNGLQYLSDNLIKLTQNKQLNGMVFEDVLLGEVTQEAVKKVSQQAKRKKIAVNLDVPNIRLNADRQSLTELLVILLDNAIKYSPEKTTVTLSAKKGIYSSPRLQNDKLEIQIKDQGIGIAKEDLPHLFDRFYRADTSRSKTDGYGLGLAIAKQIVEKHHGTIKVESKIGTGTNFVVQLPL